MDSRFDINLIETITRRRAKPKPVDAVGPNAVVQELAGNWMRIRARSMDYTVLSSKDVAAIGKLLNRRYGDNPKRTKKKTEIGPRSILVEEIVSGNTRWVQIKSPNSAASLLTPKEAKTLGAQWDKPTRTSGDDSKSQPVIETSVLHL